MTILKNADNFVAMRSQICETTNGNETPTQRLASLVLKEDVRAYIARRREVGRSWRGIAADLRRATGDAVDVTYETVRAWARTS